jgi:SPP1 family holin
MKITGGTIARTIILIIALVNQVLVAYGKSPLPIEDAQIEMLVSVTATVVISIATWWKNNSFSQAAIRADAVMEFEKSRK